VLLSVLKRALLQIRKSFGFDLKSGRECLNPPETEMQEDQNDENSETTVEKELVKGNATQ